MKVVILLFLFFLQQSATICLDANADRSVLKCAIYTKKRDVKYLENSTWGGWFHLAI